MTKKDNRDDTPALLILLLLGLGLNPTKTRRVFQYGEEWVTTGLEGEVPAPSPEQPDEPSGGQDFPMLDTVRAPELPLPPTSEPNTVTDDSPWVPPVVTVTPIEEPSGGGTPGGVGEPLIPPTAPDAPVPPPAIPPTNDDRAPEPQPPGSPVSTPDPFQLPGGPLDSPQPEPIRAPGPAGPGPIPFVDPTAPVSTPPPQPSGPSWLDRTGNGLTVAQVAEQFGRASGTQGNVYDAFASALDLLRNPAYGFLLARTGLTAADLPGSEWVAPANDPSTSYESTIASGDNGIPSVRAGTVGAPTPPAPATQTTSVIGIPSGPTIVIGTPPPPHAAIGPAPTPGAIPSPSSYGNTPGVPAPGGLGLPGAEAAILIGGGALGAGIASGALAPPPVPGGAQPTVNAGIAPGSVGYGAVGVLYPIVLTGAVETVVPPPPDLLVDYRNQPFV